MRDILICDVETMVASPHGLSGSVPPPVMKRSRLTGGVQRSAGQGQGRPSRHRGDLGRDLLWTSAWTYGRAASPRWRCRTLDIALWDAVENASGLPLHLLGPLPLANPSTRSGLLPRLPSGDGMIEKALHYVKQGYKAITMQVAHVHTPSGTSTMWRLLLDAVGAISTA